jgi:hypothetical protein
MPILRKVVRQASGVYTITLPKQIIEAKGWEGATFRVEVSGDRIVLTRVRPGSKDSVLNRKAQIS